MNTAPQSITNNLSSAGNVRLLEGIYVDLKPRFLGLAYSILRNREDAEDALQDAFVAAYRHLPEFEGRSAITTWFTRIIVNASLMLLRKRKSSKIVSPPDIGTEGDNTWMEKIQSPKPDPETLCAESETMELVENLLRPAMGSPSACVSEAP